MQLTGLHLLLTYQCTLECDHCFVWSSPWQSGTMTLEDCRLMLRQAADLGTVEWIYFEGGEPFLYYAVLLSGIRQAVEMGFRVGIVTNGYWATDVEDALEWLRPFAGLVQNISVSSDLYHWNERLSRLARNAGAAADHLGMPLGVISIGSPDASADAAIGQLPDGESRVMFRGRATEKLLDTAPRTQWSRFTECPHEELLSPRRLHVDPFGHVHVCQGLTAGNLLSQPLPEIVRSYDPAGHPVIGALLDGGPAELVQRYDLPRAEGYADACHLCYEARRALRSRFPETLTPDQMYGLTNG